MNDLYDVWFTKEELIKIDEAMHYFKDSKKYYSWETEYEPLMQKLDHLIERLK